MNERIDELFGKALDKAVPHTWTSLSHAEVESVIKVFAELIVRECVEQGKQVQSQNVSNGSKDYIDGREMGIEVFINQIRKYFGVEE